MLVNEDETEEEEDDTDGLEENGGMAQLSDRVQISLKFLRRHDNIEHHEGEGDFKRGRGGGISGLRSLS